MPLPAPPVFRAKQDDSDQIYETIVLKSTTEVAYLEYPHSEPLPVKPSEEWTRFVCISDTQAHAFGIPDGDVLLHSGDLTNFGTHADFVKTMEWLYQLPHKIKIIIAGNHDLALHEEWYEQEHMKWHNVVGKQETKPIHEMVKGQRAVNAGITYLEDEVFKFKLRENGKEWSVYGSPWSPEFFNLAFNYSRADGPDIISKFPKTDILLTHGPPYEIFDRITRGDEVGCEDLRRRLPQLRPRLHLFGHIHEAHGAYIHTWDPSNKFEPPSIQNDDPFIQSSQEVSSTFDTPANDMSKKILKERTVFVNAANWPMGERAKRNGVHAAFGGPGFQAVVVDLKELTE